MLKIMDSINNHFLRSLEIQTFEITATSIKGSFAEVYLPGMFVIIKDSYLNDGLYEVSAATTTEISVLETLKPENTGEGIRLYASVPPSDFVALYDEIEAHTETGVGVASESIDDYSVSYKDDGSWQSVFKTKLYQYRRVYNDIDTSTRPNHRWQDKLGGWY